MNNINRIIDANYNRVKEGLRVCEDIMRFIASDEKITEELKDLRHQITKTLEDLNIDKLDLIKSRSTKDDVGKKSSFDEMNKKNIQEILFANLQRVKESVRVLEEVIKIINEDKAQRFKDIRYRVYDLEKEITEKSQTIPYNQ